MKIHALVPFTGTKEERLRNYYSHDWITYDREEPPECGKCFAKTWHVTASYRCGDEPPRVTVER